MSSFKNTKNGYASKITFTLAFTAFFTLNYLYVTKASYQEERTLHMSMSVLSQILGSVLGPAFQAALSLIGENEPASKESHFQFDMYSAGG